MPFQTEENNNAMPSRNYSLRKNKRGRERERKKKDY